MINSAAQPVAPGAINLDRADDGQRADKIRPDEIEHDQTGQGKHAQAEGPI